MCLMSQHVNMMLNSVFIVPSGFSSFSAHHELGFWSYNFPGTSVGVLRGLCCSGEGILLIFLMLYFFLFFKLLLLYS